MTADLRQKLFGQVESDLKKEMVGSGVGKLTVKHGHNNGNLNMDTVMCL